MEILFAIAIFTVGVFTIGYLIIEAQVSLQKNIEYTQARLLAYEGIEAVRSIRDNEFGRLEAGTYGLVLSNAAWNLAPDSPDETSKFIRTITIEDVNTKVKHITSTVVWSNGAGQTEHDLSFESYVTNWTQEITDAEALVIHTDEATTSPSGEEITGLTLENTGPDEITITDIVGEWDNSYTLQNVSIGGTEVFSVATTSPAGVASGDTLDIEDYLMMPSIGPENIDVVTFDGSMVGASLTLRFVFSDGSSTEVQLSF